MFVTSFIPTKILTISRKTKQSKTYFLQTFYQWGHGLNESNVYRTIIKLEDILIQSGYFKLDGKKALLDDKKIKGIIVDVTETPAQRPKKKDVISEILSVLPNKNENIAAKRNVIRTKYNLS